jgi:hypothetical protein
VIVGSTRVGRRAAAVLSLVLAAGLTGTALADPSTGIPPYLVKPPPSYEELTALVRRSYEGWDFDQAVTQALAAGAERFEHNEGGYWVHKQDDLNRYAAMAAYRAGVKAGLRYGPRAEDPAHRELVSEQAAVWFFCQALTIGPLLIQTERVQWPPLGNGPLALARAERFCVMEGGWRSSEPDDGPWVSRVFMTPEEVVLMMRAEYARGAWLMTYFTAIDGVDNARYQLGREQGAPWVLEFERLAALSLYRLAAEWADEDDGHGIASEATMQYFCEAFQLAWDVTKVASQKFPLSPKARAVFVNATKDPKCQPGSWRPPPSLPRGFNLTPVPYGRTQ